MGDEQIGAREANKTCGVCGDKALGYNFNAVSCESCKAFFRRNALKNKDFRCPFTENCNVTPVTRRFCQKCRLDKCFSIGMRKEYIMTEEDKVLKRQKIERNKAKKRSLGNDNRKAKMKREDVDEVHFEDTSVSIPSVASTTSETYFWESDRKYTDLDGNRQLTLESMSPVTAASVPSPSSPPENRDIIGSKTLDMLKESSINDVSQSSEKCHISLKDDADVDINRNEVIIVEDSGCSSKSFSPSNMCDNSISINNASSSAQSSYPIKQLEHDSDIASNLHKNFEVDMNKMNDKLPKETLISELIEKPDFILQFVKNNPSVISKILQDKTIIAKLIADPEIIAMIASNLYSSKSIEQKNDEPANVESLKNNKVSDCTIHNRVDPEHNDVDHPILINFITNSKSIDQNIETEKSNSNVNLTKNTDDIARDVLQDVQKFPIAVDSIESILCQAIKFEFSAYPTPSGNQNSKQLNEAEKAKLNELIIANKALLAPLDDEIANLIGEDSQLKESGISDPMLLGLINLTAVAIRRIIKMCKKIDAFRNMCQEDQLALLKGGCVEMMMLRSVLNYDSARDMWKIPHHQESMAEIKTTILKRLKGDLYTKHGRFVRTFDSRWHDENIILILSAIALFTPDRSRVIHNDVIKLEQNSYYYLLRRYLESIFPGCEAKSTFLKLIQKISELQCLSNEVVGVYLNVNPSTIEPLLIEIFDLNK